jgi:hypothetical protein
LCTCTGSTTTVEAVSSSGVICSKSVSGGTGRLFRQVYAESISSFFGLIGISSGGVWWFDHWLVFAGNWEQVQGSF